MNKTKIAWANLTWNPVTGCSPVSEGCANCYAKRQADRFAGGDFSVKLHPEKLYEPLHLRKAARIFVCSMSDLFHPDVPDEFISAVWAVMRHLPNMTFIVLTKRPARMKQYVDLWVSARNPEQSYVEYDGKPAGHGHWSRTGEKRPPLQNVWLGVTSENQVRADERIPLLLQTPAAKRFVSIEPMIGTINLNGIWNSPEWYCPKCDREVGSASVTFEENHDLCGSPVGDAPSEIDWVICGGESGPGARECREEWIASVYEQCQAAGVPFFFKQEGKKWIPSCACECDNLKNPCRDKKCTYGIEPWKLRREWPK
jgi:protein gp37